MWVRFSNLDAVRLALTSQLVPPATQSEPLEAVIGNDGVIWIRPSKPLPKNVLVKLKTLGVETEPKTIADSLQLSCWPQLFPLEPDPAQRGASEKTVVIFELRESAKKQAFAEKQLVEVSTEMLRLGNDRQSYCTVTCDNQNVNLLRVIGPPYYTMLRVHQSRSNTPSTLRAYIERAPRVWIEVGFQHPLAEQLQPPVGSWLFLRSERQWDILPEKPFHDLYQLFDLKLPATENRWHDISDEVGRITIPLRLTYSSSSEAAELWVLRENPRKQLQQLLENADERLLGRLSFAVIERGDEKLVLIRVRPSKFPPPVLVLKGSSYRTYLKLPNLFLPVGMRLHPPLRREMVAKTLATVPQNLYWLEPIGTSDFQLMSVADSVFRPVSDWIDYLLDQEKESLNAWVGSHTFEFESYVCSEDQKVLKTAPRVPNPAERVPNQEQKKASTTAKSQTNFSSSTETKKQSARSNYNDDKPLVTETEPVAAEARLVEVEQAFLKSPAAHDSEERAGLWREMGMLHAVLKHRQDTTLSWSNALWHEPVNGMAARDWLACESECSMSGAATMERVWQLVTKKAQQPSAGSLVASFVVSEANSESPNPQLLRELNRFSKYLEEMERFLPVRTNWLASHALYRLAGHDVLALARARDRLLERLFQNGLTPEFDLASFIRSRGAANTTAFRVVCDQVSKLVSKVRAWIQEPMGANPRTKAYASLCFAFALARLGAVNECREQIEYAKKNLPIKDMVHDWMREAYLYRIEQALRGEANQGTLSDGILELLNVMERLDRYKIDRLRQHSLILEPHERLDPYRRWHRRHSDELGQQLAELHDIIEIGELRSRVKVLLEGQAKRDQSQQSRVIAAALEFAPRLGENLAVQLINQVLELIPRSKEPVEVALLLHRALYVSAHFGQIDSVQTFVRCFVQTLPDIALEFMTLKTQSNPTNKESVDAIEALFTTSFRGLRRLGMREEIGRIYGDLAEVVHSHQKSLAKSKDLDPTRSHRLLLCAASGWYYFGEAERADAVADEVARLLFANCLPNHAQRDLACAYASAVSLAPTETAVGRIGELFSIESDKQTRKLKNISDNFTTSSHFSLSQLDLIEASVLALVSEDFSLGTELRKWLDEDEFAVRSRIHQDMKSALNKSDI